MGKLLLALALVAVVFLVSAGFTLKDPPEQKVDFVPDEATAIRIAEAVLTPIHGQAQVEAQRPYVVTSPTKEYWFVYGSTYKKQVGGGFFVAVKKKSGCVTRIGIAK